MFVYLFKGWIFPEEIQFSGQDTASLPSRCSFFFVTLKQHAEQGSFNRCELLFSESTRSEQSKKEDTLIMSSVYFSPGSDSGVNG